MIECFVKEAAPGGYLQAASLLPVKIEYDCTVFFVGMLHEMDGKCSKGKRNGVII